MVLYLLFHVGSPTVTTVAAAVIAPIVVPVVFASIIVAVLAVSSIVVCLLHKKRKQQVKSVCVFNLLLCMSGFTLAYRVTASKRIIDKVL